MTASHPARGSTRLLRHTSTPPILTSARSRLQASERQLPGSQVADALPGRNRGGPGYLETVFTGDPEEPPHDRTPGRRTDGPGQRASPPRAGCGRTPPDHRGRSGRGHGERRGGTAVQRPECAGLRQLRGTAVRPPAARRGGGGAPGTRRDADVDAAARQPLRRTARVSAGAGPRARPAHQGLARPERRGRGGGGPEAGHRPDGTRLRARRRGRLSRQEHGGPGPHLGPRAPQTRAGLPR